MAGGGAGGARPRHQEVPHRGVHSPGLLMRIVDWLLSKPPGAAGGPPVGRHHGQRRLQEGRRGGRLLEDSQGLANWPREIDTITTTTDFHLPIKSVNVKGLEAVLIHRRKHLNFPGSSCISLMEARRPRNLNGQFICQRSLERPKALSC